MTATFLTLLLYKIVKMNFLSALLFYHNIKPQQKIFYTRQNKFILSGKRGFFATFTPMQWCLEVVGFHGLRSWQKSIDIGAM